MIWNNIINFYHQYFDADRDEPSMDVGDNFFDADYCDMNLASSLRNLGDDYIHHTDGKKSARWNITVLDVDDGDDCVG